METKEALKKTLSKFVYDLDRYNFDNSAEQALNVSVLMSAMIQEAKEKEQTEYDYLLLEELQAESRDQ